MFWNAKFVDVVAKLELQAFIRDCQEIGLDPLQHRCRCFFDVDVDVSVASKLIPHCILSRVSLACVDDMNEIKRKQQFKVKVAFADDRPLLYNEINENGSSK